MDQILDGITVLVVDDHTDTAAVVSEYLSGHGSDAYGVRSAYDALALLEVVAFDVVVSNLAMPCFTGLDLIERIRGDERWPSIICIAATGFAADRYSEIALSSGFDGYFEKPYSPGALVADIADRYATQQRRSCAMRAR